MYIGECKRSFKVRLLDHINAYFNNDPVKSAFAKHLIEAEHSPQAAEILHLEKNNKKRLALESIEIVKHGVHHEFEVVNRTNYIEPFINNVFSRSNLYIQTDL